MPLTLSQIIESTVRVTRLVQRPNKQSREKKMLCYVYKSGDTLWTLEMFKQLCF